MANVVADIVAKLYLDAKNFIAGVDASSSSFKKLGKDFTSVGLELSKLSLGLFAGAAAATHFSNQFNAGMANVATLIPGNVDRVNELKNAVQSMAIDVGKRTADLSDGLYHVISSFGDTSDTLGILETNAKLAAAGLSTTTDALKLTAAVTKGYGDVSQETVSKVADLAFQAVKLGDTTFPELAAAIGRVVPVAATLKVSQEELFTAFATLTGVTGGAAEVSTQLAAILRAMMDPTKEMAEAVNALGYNTAQAMIQELGMVGALTQLIGTTDGTTESVAKLFGRAEALTAVFAVTGGQADVFAEKLDQMKVSSGAMEEAFREQTEGVNKAGFTMAQVAIKAEVLAQKFGDALAPALSKVLDAVSPLLDGAVTLAQKFAELPQPIQTTALALGAALVAAGPLTLGLGQLMQAAGALKMMLPLLAASITGFKTAALGLSTLLISPAGLAAVLGVALVAAIIAVKKNFIGMESILDKGSRAMDEYAAKAEAAMEREADAAWSARDKLLELQNAARKLGITFSEDTTKSIEQNIEALESLIAKASTTSGGLRTLGGSAKETTGHFEKLSALLYQGWDKSIDAIRNMGRDLSGLAAQQQFMNALWFDSQIALRNMRGDLTDATDGFVTMSNEARSALLGIVRDAPKPEQLTPPFVAMQEEAEKTADVVKDSTKEQKRAWEDYLRGVSTAVTDMAKKLSNTFVELFWGGGDAREKLREQRADLEESLQERGQAYSEYAAEVAASLEEAEQDYIQQVADNTQEIETSLQDRETAYQDFVAEIADKEDEARANYAESLASQLEDLRDNLADRTKDYEDYVKDIEKKLGRIREDFEENLDDERKDLDESIREKRQDTQRDISDAQTALDRKLRDLQNSLDDELAKGRNADQSRIRDLRIRIEDEKADFATLQQRKLEDLGDFIAEQNTAFDEFVSDQRTRYTRQQDDLNESLQKRKEDYADYVSDAAAKEAAIRQAASDRLADQLADLQASVVAKTAEYEKFKTDAAAKLDDLNAAAKEKYDQQVTDLNAALAKQLTELEAFKTEANNKLAKIGEDEAGLSFASKLKAAFHDMIFGADGFVASLMRLSTENILKTFLDPLSKTIEGIIGKLIGEGGLLSVFGKIKDAIAGLFGGGTQVVGQVVGSAGQAGAGAATGAAGAAGTAGTAATGLTGSLISGGIAAAGSIVGGALTAWMQGGDLGRIEENTRQTAIGLNSTDGVNTTLRNYLPWLESIKEAIWVHQISLLGQIHDRLVDAVPKITTIRDDLATLAGTDGEVKNGFALIEKSNALWSDKVVGRLDTLIGINRAGFNQNNTFNISAESGRSLADQIAAALRLQGVPA